MQEYVSFRLNENVPIVIDKKKMIPKEVQEGLNVYATFYLALPTWSGTTWRMAETMFSRLLEMLPEPGPNQPILQHVSLGCAREPGPDLRGQEATSRQAIAHYTQTDPTMQHHGNLLRARELVWEDPMAVPSPIPPPPRPSERLAR